MNLLVTGFPRSGTTFVGRTIAAGNDVHYVREPFNAKYPAPGTRFREYGFWRPDLDSVDDVERLEKLDSVFLARPCWPNLGLKDFPRSPAFFLKHSVRCLLPQTGPMLKEHVLIKDPMAVCATDVLAKRYDMKVIVMIRNPVEVVDSVRRYGWKLRPSVFLEQATIAEAIEPDERRELEISQHRTDMTSLAAHVAYAWKITYRLLAMKAAQLPHVVFVRHDDLVAEPKAVIRRVVSELGLSMNGDRERFINKHSDSPNASANPAAHDIRRGTINSSEKKPVALDADSVEVVKEIAGDIEIVCRSLRAASAG